MIDVDMFRVQKKGRKCNCTSEPAEPYRENGCEQKGTY
jgi:hypothetical protein